MRSTGGTSWLPLANMLCGILLDSDVRTFRFRILEGTMDSYWASRDSGERHVFEIGLANGILMHSHFHKNGKLDDPVM